jgi:hypothetical protein
MTRVLKAVFVLAVVAGFASRAQADGSNPVLATYDVTGNLTIVGNAGCTGACTESVSYSFMLDYTSTSNSPIDTSYDPVQQGPFSISSSGPLNLDTGHCCSNFAPSSGLLEITNGVTPGTTDGYDEIDIQLLFGANPSTPPTLGYADIFACESTACVQNFSTYGTATYGQAIPIDGAFSATAVPEPPVWMLLLSGLLLVGLFRVAYTTYGQKQAARLA